MKRILGLDLGTTSVGWALISKGNDSSDALIDGGVRIFAGVTEGAKNILKNKARREKRGSRRNVRRRRTRKAALKKALVEADLLPREVLRAANVSEVLNRISANPYELRAAALDRKLEDHQLGRALLHLGNRRGFLSNRKVGNDRESRVVGRAITELQRAIEETDSRTLGKYLSKQQTQRRRYTERAMYAKEFEAIWNQQSRTNPKLTDQLHEKLHHCIFFQNPLKIQKFLIGKCTLEPNKRRAAKWQPIAQTLRIWQDVSRIRTTHDHRPLHYSDQRQLVDELHRRKSMTWNQVRSFLRLDTNTQFNLEESGSLKKLLGNATQVTLISALGEYTQTLTCEEKQKILNWLATSDNDRKLREKIERGFDFDEQTVSALLNCSLPTGYFHLSVRACRNLIRVFEGSVEPLTYREAAEKSGYHMDEMGEAKDGVERLGAPPKLRNPVVEKSLVELKRVVNAVIRVYGKPDLIRLEMARDLKNSKKVRDTIQKHNREQEKKRADARERLKEEFPIFKNREPTREDIEKYLLWKECFENCNGQCPYTGAIISGDMLFSQEVQVEHIIPYSRSFDNSFKNKTLCLAGENARKGNKTPHELYHGTSQYDEVLARVEKLPFKKRRRFSRTEVAETPDASRELNDTRYICREAKRYVQTLGIRVQVSTGQFTAGLRRKWNLNGILQPNNTNRKNREDHRHHFIDAVIVANVDAGMVNRIAQICRHERLIRNLQGGIFTSKSTFPKPWQGFRQVVKTKVDEIVVSHAPTRKISGGLHEDTALGRVNTRDGAKFIHRIELNKDFKSRLTPNIADGAVRKLVEERLAAHNNDPKHAFADMVNDPLCHRDGKTPIKRVRILSNDSFETLAPRRQNDNVYAYYKKGNNYKVRIYELPGGKWKGHYITAFDAKSGHIITPPELQRAKLIMELCKNDMVRMDWKARREFVRLQKMSEPNDTLVFRLHHSNQTKDTERATLRQVSSNSFKKTNPQKIEISPIGKTSFLHGEPDC